VKSRVPPELVFSEFNRCYLYYARSFGQFHSRVTGHPAQRLRTMQSKVYGIIRSVKKLGIMVAIALPLVCAFFDGKGRSQTFPSLPVIYLEKLAFESSPGRPPIFGLFPPTKLAIYGEVSVIDAPNSNPRMLVKGQGPTWSPNGRRVAFCLSDDLGIYYAQIINADGTGQVPLTAVKVDACPSDWSPDGEKLAFTDSGHFPHMVAITDADGRNFRRITEGFDPQWSPDGKQLVFYRNVKGTKERRTAIWIANVDGTGARKIIEEDAPSLPSLSWNSLGPARFFDGNRIVFSSDRAHNWCIFRVNLDGTGLEKIAESDQYDLFHPSFSPDGKQLVVQGDRRPTDANVKPERVILLLDLATKQWTRLVVGTYPSVLWGTKSRFGEVILDRGSMFSSNTSLVAQGRERYLSYKCDECHGANGEGGGDGPDLINTNMNATEISKFLEKPSPDAYMKGMPNIPTDLPDNQALVAYVLNLKRPPNPR